MLRRNTTLFAALALMAVGPLVARAEVADAVPFPFDQVDRGTFAVGFTDLSRSTAESIAATAKILAGELADEMIPAGTEAINKLYRPLNEAGAERIYVAISLTDIKKNGGAPLVELFVRHKRGADRAGIADAFAGIGTRGATAPIGDRWLRITPANQQAQPGLDAATTGSLVAGLAAADSGAFGFTFVLTGEFRELIAGELKNIDRRIADQPGDQSNLEASVIGMIRSALGMKSGHLTIALGEQPAFHGVVTAADAEAAAGIAASLDKIRAGLDDEVKRQGAGADEVVMIGMVLNLIKPTQDSSTLTMTVTTDQLRTFGQNVLVPAIARAREAAKQAQVMNNIRQIATGATAYAVDHGTMPDSIDQMRAYFGGADELARVMTHPISGENPGFEYVKPADKLSDVRNASTTPMVYELRHGKRHDQGAIGYVDGHVERPPPPLVQ